MALAVIILMLIFSGLTAFVVHIKLSYDYEIPFITKTTMFVVEIPSNIKDLIEKNKKFSSPLNKNILSHSPILTKIISRRSMVSWVNH